MVGAAVQQVPGDAVWSWCLPCVDIIMRHLDSVSLTNVTNLKAWRTGSVHQQNQSQSDNVLTFKICDGGTVFSTFTVHHSLGSLTGLTLGKAVWLPSKHTVWCLFVHTHLTSFESSDVSGGADVHCLLNMSINPWFLVGESLYCCHGNYVRWGWITCVVHHQLLHHAFIGS